MCFIIYAIHVWNFVMSPKYRILTIIQSRWEQMSRLLLLFCALKNENALQEWKDQKKILLCISYCNKPYFGVLCESRSLADFVLKALVALHLVLFTFLKTHHIALKMSGEFEAWLSGRLSEFNADGEVFSSYILGILNDNDSDSDKEKEDNLADLLEGLGLDDGSPDPCQRIQSEIWTKWTKLSAAAQSHSQRPENCESKVRFYIWACCSRATCSACFWGFLAM